MTHPTFPDYPEDSRDKALEVLKSIAKVSSGAVPVVGPFFSEAIELLYKIPLDKRRQDWFDQLVDAIRELTTKVDNLEKLSKNEEFITTLHRATDLALRTHQREKRTLLRNAVVSAGSPAAPELDKQTFFLRLIDELSVIQILVLLLYQEPTAWFKKRGIKPIDYSSAGAIEAFNQAYPKLAKDPYVKELVFTELERRGLLHNVSVMVTLSSVYNPRTTKLGIEFLDYVSAQSIEPQQ